MEDYDDVTTGPEENGALNLSFNSWPKVPCEVFTFSKQLVKLNLSNNKLDILSSDFGSLFLLQGMIFIIVTFSDGCNNIFFLKSLMFLIIEFKV